MVAIDAAPDEGFAVLGNGDGVVLASVHMSNAVTFEVEIVDEGGSVDDGVIIPSSFGDAATTKAIDTPGPESIFLINSKGVVGTGEDGFVGLDSCAKGLGLERRLFILCTSTLDDMVAELILFSRTPNEHTTLIVQSYGVVGAAFDMDDVLQLWDKDG